MSAFSFEIKKGKILFKQGLWDAIKRFIQTLPDGRYTWQHPKKHRNTRSSQQNNYYFGVVVALSMEDTGYSKNEMHQIFGDEFLKYEKNGREFIRSTTDLNTKEFEEYLEQCRQYASEKFSCYIPLPNEPHNFYYDMVA